MHLIGDLNFALLDRMNKMTVELVVQRDKMSNLENELRNLKKVRLPQLENHVAQTERRRVHRGNSFSRGRSYRSGSEQKNLSSSLVIANDSTFKKQDSVFVDSGRNILRRLSKFERKLDRVLNDIDDPVEAAMPPHFSKGKTKNNFYKPSRYNHMPPHVLNYNQNHLRNPHSPYVQNYPPATPVYNRPYYQNNPWGNYQFPVNQINQIKSGRKPKEKRARKKKPGKKEKEGHKKSKLSFKNERPKDESKKNDENIKKNTRQSLEKKFCKISPINKPMEPKKKPKKEKSKFINLNKTSIDNVSKIKNSLILNTRSGLTKSRNNKTKNVSIVSNPKRPTVKSVKSSDPKKKHSKNDDKDKALISSIAFENNNSSQKILSNLPKSSKFTRITKLSQISERSSRSKASIFSKSNTMSKTLSKKNDNSSKNLNDSKTKDQLNISIKTKSNSKEQSSNNSVDTDKTRETTEKNTESISDTLTTKNQTKSNIQNSRSTVNTKSELKSKKSISQNKKTISSLKKSETSKNSEKNRNDKSNTKLSKSNESDTSRKSKEINKSTYLAGTQNQIKINEISLYSKSTKTQLDHNINKYKTVSYVSSNREKQLKKTKTLAIKKQPSEKYSRHLSNVSGKTPKMSSNLSNYKKFLKKVKERESLNLSYSVISSQLSSKSKFKHKDNDLNLEIKSELSEKLQQARENQIKKYYKILKPNLVSIPKGSTNIFQINRINVKRPSNLFSNLNQSSKVKTKKSKYIKIFRKHVFAIIFLKRYGIRAMVGFGTS